MVKILQVLQGISHGAVTISSQPASIFFSAGANASQTREVVGPWERAGECAYKEQIIQAQVPVLVKGVGLPENDRKTMKHPPNPRVHHHLYHHHLYHDGIPIFRWNNVQSLNVSALLVVIVLLKLAARIKASLVNWRFLTWDLYHDLHHGLCRLTFKAFYTFLHSKKDKPRFQISKSLRCGYGSIPIDTFLVGWTSIYQLFWGSLGTRVLTHPHVNDCERAVTKTSKGWSAPRP